MNGEGVKDSRLQISNVTYGFSLLIYRQGNDGENPKGNKEIWESREMPGVVFMKCGISPVLHTGHTVNHLICLLFLG